MTIDIDDLESRAKTCIGIDPNGGIAIYSMELLALIAEVRALREDAERWRWLRQENSDYLSNWGVDIGHDWAGENLDEVVDTARGAK